MSSREEAVLWLGGLRRTGGGVAGGNVFTATGTHRLDGPEHTEAADSTALDATSDHHGLLAKLSGDIDDVVRGDGTIGRSTTGSLVPYFIAPGDTFRVPLGSQALFAMTIDNEGILDVVGYLVEVD